MVALAALLPRISSASSVPPLLLLLESPMPQVQLQDNQVPQPVYHW